MNRLTPLEIQRTVFPRSWRGLDPDAVQEFLSQLTEQIEDEARQRGELRGQLARQGQELEELRQQVASLSLSVESAQRTAKETIAHAETEAQRIVAEAQAFADRVVDDAARRAENVELVINQLRTQRRGARADIRRIADLLAGAARDDESAEQRELEAPSVALLRHRQRESTGER
jgi:cell division initiation protein